MAEHEHGLGASGLRRIRQQPTARHPTLPSALSHGLADVDASPKTTWSLPGSRLASVSSGRPISPYLSPHDDEDLTRFSSESLHSFSFARQPEEAIYSRPNAIRRSIDLMFDRLTANPGLISAQSSMSRDAESRRTRELLSPARSDLNPEELHLRSAWGWPCGSWTGPPDVKTVDPLESVSPPRSASPGPIETSSAVDGMMLGPRRNVHPAEEAGRAGSIDVPGTSETKRNVSIRQGFSRSDGRPGLKRTSTDLAPLWRREKLMDTLAVPSRAAVDGAITAPLSPTFVHWSSIAGPAPTSATLHAHSSRWVPAAQAIFTTELSSPWTILAANDLACLVFGLTKAEVRKVGIMEVVREDRRAWLEDRLRSPSLDATNKTRPSDQARTANAGGTRLISPASGRGVTAQLLNKPSWRNRRSQTENSGQTPAAATVADRRWQDHKGGGGHHVSHGSRGVLLCGDVVPIRKRNGAMGAASVWIKEKRGGLVWVLEEITEDVAILQLDHSGRVTAESGSATAIWGAGISLPRMDITALLPTIPRQRGGPVDRAALARCPQLTVRTAERGNVPATVEPLPDGRGLRVSSFPHIAGMMVVSASDLTITSSNAVFSAALFGRAQPDGLPVTELIVDFDRILVLLFEKHPPGPVDGMVIPEQSFRRARALLDLREGAANAATVLLRPNGLPARHRDGSEIRVDVQMRVVKSATSELGRLHQAVVVVDDDDDDDGTFEAVEGSSGPPPPSPPLRPGTMYALWITYSRRLHATGPSSTVGDGSIITPLVERPETSLHQCSSGQTQRAASPPPGSSAMEGGKRDDVVQEQMTTGTETPLLAGTDAEITMTLALAPSIAAIDAEVKTKMTTTTTATTKTAVGLRSPRSKKMIDDFIILEDMGQGAYGQVKLARYKHSGARKMVLKYVTKRRILVDTWTRDRRLGTVPLEIHVLDYLRRDGLKHPNIVEMSDFFEDDVNYYIEMVPHGLPGMDLFDYIELRVNMDEVECRSIFRQVVNAIHHLHTKALVVHRDIKDENVILDGEGKIKLIDFGSATYIKNGPFDVFVGTIGKTSPFPLTPITFVTSYRQHHITKQRC